MKHVLLLIALLAFSVFAKDMQTAPGAYAIDLTRYDFIDTTLNVIQYPRGTPRLRHFSTRWIHLFLKTEAKFAFCT